MYFQIGKLGVKSRLLVPSAIFATHTPSCPTAKPKVCPGSGGKAAGGSKGPGLKRATHSAKCRLVVFPEEWFQFFHPITGVSGPYVFGIVLWNYLLSKEIYIMEHEYYLGLSFVVVLALVVNKMGPDIGASLDKEVDDILKGHEATRTEEKAEYEAIVKAAEDAKWRADGQKLLMDAKKENIQMQLEAIYRERMMMVYRSVKGRMDYHLKRYQAEARIHQKWMSGWILENVLKSITPELEKRALDQAIQDLASAAGRAK